MLIVLSVLAFLFFGWESARVLARKHESGPFEHATWAAVIAVALWLGSVWALALAKLMIPWVLLTRSAVVAVLAVVMRRRWGGHKPPAVAPKYLLLLAPIALWMVFVMWRGTIIPPLTHDALAYHLPKAVMYARAGGFEVLEALDPRIRDIPASYEMLLAESLVLEGNDDLTEWHSTLFYLLFAVAAGALAERWWRGRELGAAAACLLTAGVPVVLLGSGLHKNDLMIGWAVVAALVAAGRWLTTGERFSLLLSITAFAIAVGTKPQGGLLALAITPFLAWRWWRMPRRWRELAIAVPFAVAAFFLLGGVVYVTTPPTTGQTPIVYGDWSNLWQGPWVLLAAPFSPNPFALRVPWETTSWFWRKYEIYFSHAGVPFVLCALALPLVLARIRGSEGPAFERIAVTVASVITVAIMLPVVFTPHGLYTVSLPRYVVFLYPVAFAAVIPAMTMRAGRGVVVGSLVVFVWYAIENGTRDTFVPPRYLKYAIEHRGTRVVAFEPNRAASVLDRAAGPHETVAFDAGFGSWLHPAFGRELTRKLVVIPQDGAIPDEADWVVVDRAWSIIWGHPDLRDLSQTRYLLGRGWPLPEDLRVVHALRRDERFETVFYNPRINQAVFRRVHK